MFTLWGPRNKSGVIVRIYLDVDGENAYIWRKSTKHRLEIVASSHLRDYILSILAADNIDLASIPSRRRMAEILYDKGLLKGNYRPYLQDYISSQRLNQSSDQAPVPEKKSQKNEPNKSNVVNFSDYFKK